MEYLFFNEQGILNLDEMVANNETFKKIMADGIVTDDEIKELSSKIIAQLHEIEQKYSKEQLSEIRSLLVESSVLYAVYHYQTLHEINNTIYGNL